MKAKSKKLLPAVCAAVLLLSLLFTGAAYSAEGKKAYAGPVVEKNINTPVRFEQGDYDSYTDDDKISNEKGEEIFILDSYSSSQLGSNFTFKKGQIPDNIDDDASNDFGISAVADDPIVYVVPKELFAHRGNYLYIGRNYGFFVHTEAHMEGNNISTVMVFDITREIMNSENYLDQCVIRVQPLFSYKYFYLPSNNRSVKLPYYDSIGPMPEGTLPETYCSVSNNVKDIVVPVPTALKTGANALDIEYWEDDTYFLNNILFSGALYNKEDQNAGERNEDGSYTNGYLPENDNGAFFIRTDYQFSGVGKRGEATETISAGLKYGIGLFPIPVLGYINTIKDGLDLFIKMLTDSKGSYQARESISSGPHFSEISHNTKNKQVEANGFLNKNTTCGFVRSEESDGKPLLFGRSAEGNYAQAHFTVSETESWYTEFLGTISMDVVTSNLQGLQYIEMDSGTGASCYGSSFNESKTKTVSLSEYQAELPVYVLPGGVNRFEVTPSLNGLYEFNTGKSGVEYSIYNADTNEKIQTGNGKCYLFGDERYRIEAGLKDPAAEGEYKIAMLFSPQKLEDEQVVQKLGASTTDYLQFDMREKGVFNVSIKSVNSAEFRYYIVNYAWEIKSHLMTGINRELSVVLPAGKYFIVLENLTAEEQTVEANCLENTSIEGVGQALENQRVDLIRYYKFISPADGMFRLSTISANDLTLKLLGSDLIEKSATNNADFNVLLQKGYTYYFSINNSQDNAAMVYLTVAYVPAELKLQNNNVSVNGESFYRFVVDENAIYGFATDNGDFSIGIFNEEFKSLGNSEVSGTTTTQRLIPGVYFIKVTGNGNAQLHIGIVSVSSEHNQLMEAITPSGGFTYYSFTAPKSGEYGLRGTGNIKKITLFDAAFNKMVTSSEAFFTYTLTENASYYIRLDADKDTVITFQYYFNPPTISINTSYLVGHGYYTIEVDKSTAYKLILEGRDASYVKAFLEDKDFNVIEQYSADHYNLLEGRYYIRITAEDKSAFLSVNYVNAIDDTECVTIEEGVYISRLFESRTVKNYQFTAQYLGKHEVRLYAALRDSYGISVSFVSNAGVVQDVTSTFLKTESDNISRYVFHGDHAIGSGVYSITIRSLMDVDANNFSITIARPSALDTISYNLESSDSADDRDVRTLYANGTKTDGTFYVARGRRYRFNTTLLAGTATGVEFRTDSQAAVFTDNLVALSPDIVLGSTINFRVMVDYEEVSISFVTANPYNPYSEFDGNVYNIKFKSENGKILQIIPENFSMDVKIEQRLNGVFQLYEIQYEITTLSVNLTGLAVFQDLRISAGIKYGSGLYATSVSVDTDKTDANYRYNAVTFSVDNIVGDWLKIDATQYSTSVNKVITIPQTVNAVNIFGNSSTFYGVSFKIDLRHTALLFNLNNFKFTGNSAFSAIEYTPGGSYTLTLNCIGINTVAGYSGKDAIYCYDLRTIGDGSLTVNGGNGTTGQNGGYGVRAASTVQIDNRTFHADGGNGGTGASGSSGSVGNSSHMNGYNGGDGGRGGNGGNGLYCGILYISASNTAFSATGGNAGQGGAGGRGGNGAGGLNGSSSSGSNGGNGGNGGKGGNGGSAGSIGLASNYTVSNKSFTDGNYARSGNGGGGGNGGSGGNGANDNSNTDKSSAAGNGGHGGSGGTGYTDGRIGNGGNGGKGGDAGANGYGEAGGRGGDGYYGGRGGNGGSATGAFQRGGVGGRGGDGYGGGGGNGGNGGEKVDFPGTSGHGGNGGDGYNYAYAGTGGIPGRDEGAAEGKFGADGTKYGAKVYPY